MIENYVEKFQQIITQCANPQWMNEKRHEAMDIFAKLGFPTSGEEAWKYTKLLPLEKHFFESLLKPSEKNIPLKQILPFLIFTKMAHRLVFIDGYFYPTLSQILPNLPNQTFLLSVNAALINSSISFEKEFTQTINAQYPHFSAFNTAFMSDGAYITIAENVKLAEPIELIYINTTPQSATHYRNLIQLEKGAKAEISEHYFSLHKNAYFTNKITQVSLEKNAILNYSLIQEESSQAIHIGALEIDQYSHSHFNFHGISLSGQLLRNDIRLRLHESETQSQLNGLYIASQQQHVDYHTYIDHLSPHGTSHELFKGIITDRARAVFNGKIQVHPGANKTDAQLQNKNLLLSRHAEIDTKPELEIYTDDVKCSHGATVGQLDENSLFYLQSRGIDQQNAQQLLTYAFAQEILETISQAELKEYLQQRVAAHLLTLGEKNNADY